MVALAAVVNSASPALADPITGACALRLTIQFESAVRPPVAAPSYGLEATGAADLDVTTPGIQPCAVTLSSDASTETSAQGNGSALAWSCTGTLGQGSWEQSFGEEGPAGFDGTHVLTGAWGSWTLHLQSRSLKVAGVGELTLDPADATKTLGCGVGSTGSVTMIGVVVFQTL